MRARIIILIFILLAIRSKAADNTKIIIGIVPFNYADNNYKKQAEQLQDIVTRIFNENSRISLLDRSKMAAIQKELDIQKGKEYIGGKTVKQNKAYGAQYIIIGTLTNIDIEKSVFGKITTTSKCKISFTLQKVDVTTGEVNATKVFDIATSGSVETETYKKESDQFKNVIRINAEKINHEVRNWTTKLFPPTLKFYQVEQKDRKGIPKFVSLIAGSDVHVAVGDLISIIETVDFEFEGQTKHRKTEVAVVKIKEMQGDVVKCSIISGEKIIEEKTNGTHNIEIIKKE
jgi:hypothetical protein